MHLYCHQTCFVLLKCAIFEVTMYVSDAAPTASCLLLGILPETCRHDMLASHGDQLQQTAPLATKTAISLGCPDEMLTPKGTTHVDRLCNFSHTDVKGREN